MRICPLVAVLALVTACAPAHRPAESLLDPREHHLAHARQLTFGGENAEAYWSDDGRRLVFQAHGGAHGDVACDQIYTMRADGTDVRKLTDSHAFSGNPSWSPDGTTIVYEGQQSAVAPLIAVHADGSDVGRFPAISVPAGGQGRSRFLSNGHIVYLAAPVSTQDFFDLDLATFKSRPIAHLQSPSVVNAFDIAPDGRHIVFDRLREQSEIRLIDLPKK